MNYLLTLLIIHIRPFIILLFNTINPLACIMSKPTLFMIISFFNRIISNLTEERYLSITRTWAISLKRVGRWYYRIWSFGCSICYKIIALIGHISLTVYIDICLSLNIYHRWYSLTVSNRISFILIYPILIFLFAAQRRMGNPTYINKYFKISAP